MGGIFNAQILVDKLAKLNSSQQSIETLSHWCIFHRTKARQVVETWNQQFHRSPRERRVSFLYLANDILQNSRRKGSEFVVEFWRVLPDALNDVIQSEDEFGRNAATRLVDIWEERKVFGSRGQVLKEDLLGRNHGNHSILGKNTNNIPKSVGDALDKLISTFEHVYGGSLAGDALLNKCQNVITYIEKMENEINNSLNSGITSGSEVIQDLQAQHSVLRECIEQLNVAESSRVVLISHLKEALHDEEFKLEQVRDKLQISQARLKSADNIFEQLANIADGQLSSEQRHEDAASAPVTPQNFPDSKPITVEKDQLAPVTYNQNVAIQENPSRTSDDNIKTTAAAMAAKLAASTSSAEMLSSLLSSLASEGIIGQQTSQDTSDSSKRIKLDNGMSCLPQQQQAQPVQFPLPDSRIASIPPPPATPLQPSSAMLHNATMQQLQMPQSLPLQPPLRTHQLAETAGSTTSMPYNYGVVPPVCLPPVPPVCLPPVPPSSITSSGVHPYSASPNSYRNVQVSEGANGFLAQPSQLPTTVPTISHQ